MELVTGTTRTKDYIVFAMTSKFDHPIDIIKIRIHAAVICSEFDHPIDTIKIRVRLNNCSEFDHPNYEIKIRIKRGF